MSALRAVWRYLTSVSVRTWAVIGAAPALTALAWLMIGLIRVGWSAEREAQQLGILGNALYGVLVIVAVAVIALAGVAVKGKGPGGTEFEVDGHD